MRKRLAVLIALSSAAVARADDLRGATIVTAPTTPSEAAAVQMLVDEVRKRAGVTWPVRSKAPRSPPLILIGRRSQIAHLAPQSLRPIWRADAPRPAGSEGFSIRTFGDARRRIIVIAGDDARGVLYGAGYLLRKLQTGPGQVELSRPLRITTAPVQAIRGSQFGYRPKNNTYDAWNIPLFEQRIREFAMFGANTIQVIAPQSDDAAASPLFPAPPLETLAGIGEAAHKYGLDFDLYYPELATDYATEGALTAELAKFETLVKQLPRIDALFVPGGDPGDTPPDVLFALAQCQAEILRRYNPKAKVWISAQGFDRRRYESFYALLRRRPAWLTGVFFGPQSRDPMPVQRRRIPARYPILFYPDVGHTLHAQFPVPNWDPAFALTEGREPIDPRPIAETAIFRHFATLNRGFVTYSEGVNDDVNTLLWFQLGWSPRLDPHQALGDYSRVFLGSQIGTGSSDRFAAGLFDLERNWVGPVAANGQIDETLKSFDAMEAAAAPAQRENWRFEAALYRACYDAYVRRRMIAEAGREQAALLALATAPSTGSLAAMDAATQSLNGADDAMTMALRKRLFDLADRLHRHVGLQLSVKLYGASDVERGANLDKVDASLNDRVWLTGQFTEITRLMDEPARRSRLARLADWSGSHDGALYDDLGAPGREPRLVRGKGFARDPEFYDTANDGAADNTPDDGWRMSWVTYAETLYDRPMTLRYHGLDRTAAYRLRVTYAGEGYHLPMRLVANGIYVLQDINRPSNPATVELDLPRAATATGALTLQWAGPSGAGGSGRGHQIAETWLFPQSQSHHTACVGTGGGGSAGGRPARKLANPRLAACH